MPVTVSLHVATSTLGGDQRGVDPVEVVVRDDDRGDAGLTSSDGAGRQRRGLDGRRQGRAAGVRRRSRRPPSSSRRPRTPATTEAAATDPARIRKLRRDQSGIDPAVAPRSAPRGTAQASSHDSVSMPANPATPATTACGAAETDGSPSEARKPIAANAAIVSAAAANDRRATIPRPAPISSATATIRISSASLSFVPKSADDEVLRAGRLVVDDPARRSSRRATARRGSPRRAPRRRWPRAPRRRRRPRRGCGSAGGAGQAPRRQPR